MSFSALKSCSERIENYLRCQPGYPKKLLNFLYEEVGFSRESVIADVCSGIGVFTRLLLERGSRVVAIEPDNQMREIAERLLSDEFQRFVSLNATVENTTLFDNSVNHIVCTHSLNRFCKNKCKNEFLRILKPAGTVVLIYNRLEQEDDFVKAYQRLLNRYKIHPEKPECQEISETEIFDFFDNTAYNYVSVPNQQSLDFEGAKGRLLSERSLPLQWEDGYNEMLENLHDIFETYKTNRRIFMNYRTEVYIGRLKE